MSLQQRIYYAADDLAVCLACHLGHDEFHDLAEFLLGGAGLGNDLFGDCP